MTSTPAIVTTLSVIGAIAGVSGLAVSVYQARLSRRAANLTALLSVYKDYQSTELRAARRKIYRSDYDMSHLSRSDEEELRALLNVLEFLGTLVDEKVVGLNIVRSLFRHSPEPVWAAAWPFIQVQRTVGDPEPVPEYARNFERLIRRYGRL